MCWQSYFLNTKYSLFIQHASCLFWEVIPGNADGGLGRKMGGRKANPRIKHLVFKF